MDAIYNDRSTELRVALDEMLLRDTQECFVEGDYYGAIGRLRLLLTQSPDFKKAQELLVEYVTSFVLQRRAELTIAELEQYWELIAPFAEEGPVIGDNIARVLGIFATLPTFWSRLPVRFRRRHDVWSSRKPVLEELVRQFAPAGMDHFNQLWEHVERLNPLDPILGHFNEDLFIPAIPKHSDSDKWVAHAILILFSNFYEQLDRGLDGAGLTRRAREVVRQLQSIGLSGDTARKMIETFIALRKGR